MELYAMLEIVVVLIFLISAVGIIVTDSVVDGEDVTAAGIATGAATGLVGGVSGADPDLD
ncbi:hypothetical protein GCM10008927_06400 [Amylibacter ulvae]|uniref:Glycine zipper domain-containing protein n=1 Tax=Paramylibacter ulvae TaxID=1651968 RepID=A0ABQ3CWF4_9RHOB|nr:hypothetical protein GCM10008927_06400 [Amylibacter ulvae]